MRSVLIAVALGFGPAVLAQEEQPPEKAQPAHEDTFAGPIVELSATKITVSRNVVGKTEKRTFVIKADTRVEGKLRVKEKVTVGFVSTDEGDIARLIVAHPKDREK